MKQFAVIGLGRFGSSVARTLYSMGYDVLAVDSDEAKVQEMADEVTHAVQADATDEEVLKSLGIRNFDVAVVSIGTDVQASIMATLVLKELGVPYIVAKALNVLHGKVLEKIGADRVVYPERDMGIRVANNLVSANMLDYIELAPGYSIVEFVASREFVGKTLRQLGFRAKYGINIMAIKRGDEIQVSPGAEDKVQGNDILIAMGPDEQLEALERA
ncbi:MAG: TrkA family potassium uptake protein [Firmicutes bacterium]|nr:TrkA family potassium uptake protein [Bacillota bacterium]